MRTFLILAFVALAFAAVASASSHKLSATQTANAWLKFKVEHGKTYRTVDEERMRFRVFRANLRRVSKMNKRHHAAGGATVFGMTKFADLTPSEFRHMYLMPHRPLPEVRPEQVLPKLPQLPQIPQAWDWRFNGSKAPAVTPVKNQGQCGSCWAFSATEQTESMNWLQGFTTPITVLSEQQVVDCCTKAYGCNGGWTYVAYEYIMEAGGYDSESEYPYRAVNGNCQFKPSGVKARIASWKYVTQSDQVSEMQNYLASTGPLSICVDAASWQFYSGGVLKTCGQQIDHCVQLTGYSTVDGTDAWNVRNSWGADWGQQGYIYIERGENLCAIGNVVTTITGESP